ncbi:MAG: hypothetical protein HC836_16815 [Richelia sp. RM2_1_2]|nr:hypothetical protein [Richelia sp. RM2_1_2]
MAVTYNFTVRALDTSGAFADRAFSLTINNTAVYRFIAVGGSNTYKSYDGISWEVDAGVSGIQVEYGNGVWLMLGNGGVSPDGTSISMLRSSDGVTWDSYQAPITIAGGTPPFPSGQLIAKSVQYFNNTWFLLYSGTVDTFLILASSTDNGLTWSTVSKVGSISTFHDVSGFVYNPNTGHMLISTQSTPLYMSTDGGLTWDTVSTPAGSFYNGERIAYANGVYFYLNGNSGTTTPCNVYRSINGVNWTTVYTGPSSTTGPGSPVYGNGIFAFAATNTGVIAKTTDGGTTWVNNSALGTNSVPHQRYQGIAFNYGTWVRVNNPGTTFSYSRNNMSTWTDVSVSGMTNTRYIGIRP